VEAEGGSSGDRVMTTVRTYARTSQMPDIVGLVLATAIWGSTFLVT
jgi:hypothetical protein